MRDLDLKSLRLLVAVCDHLSIKAAADQEHIEPSAISKRIAQMEESLGTKLLIRGRRGVEPTPTGLTLLEHARTMLFTMERIESDVAAYNGGVHELVRLVASASAVAESLPDDVAEFMRDPGNQRIKVDIEERLSTDVVRSVRDGSASIGICWDSVDLQGLNHLPYREDQLALAVHVDHPLASRRSVWFEQTLDFDHVGLPPTTSVYRMLQRAAAKSGKPLSYRVVVSNFDAALRVVSANLGISVIPSQVRLMGITRSETKAIPLTDAWAKRRFVACFRDAEELPPAAARMLTFLTRKVSL